MLNYNEKTYTILPVTSDTTLTASALISNHTRRHRHPIEQNSNSAKLTFEGLDHHHARVLLPVLLNRSKKVNRSSIGHSTARTHHQACEFLNSSADQDSYTIKRHSVDNAGRMSPKFSVMRNLQYARLPTTQ
jgi:hypothetical protein